jgi:hypothetical protein
LIRSRNWAFLDCRELGPLYFFPIWRTALFIHQTTQSTFQYVAVLFIKIPIPLLFTCVIGRRAFVQSVVCFVWPRLHNFVRGRIFDILQIDFLRGNLESTNSSPTGQYLMRNPHVLFSAECLRGSQVIIEVCMSNVCGHICHQSEQPRFPTNRMQYRVFSSLPIGCPTSKISCDAPQKALLRQPSPTIHDFLDIKVGSGSQQTLRKRGKRHASGTWYREKESGVLYHPTSRPGAKTQ